MESAVVRPAPSPSRPAWNKVPEITLYFWVIKILCTTVGETVADFLSKALGVPENLGMTMIRVGVISAAVLGAALAVQFRYRKYVPWIYWLVVVLVSIVGTIITDYLHDVQGYELGVLSLVFAAALAIVFALWYSIEKTLSIRTIYTPRREGFYWAAILATFALGTAAGDWLLETLQDALGAIPAPTPGGEDLSAHPQAALLICAGLFAAVIALAALGHLAFKWNSVLMFWVAYIFTRPLGANIGDFLSLDPDQGGLGLGPAVVSGIFLGLILACIVYLTVTKRDARPDPHFIVETQAEQARHARRP